MNSIYNISWEESSFSTNRRLFFLASIRHGRKIGSSNPHIRAQGYSILSDTYRSIYTTAGVKFREILKPWWLAPFRVAFWCITWLPIATWCYLRALPLSNKVVDLLGYNGMSVSMCYARQIILVSHGKYHEARKCLSVGLSKIPEEALTQAVFYAELANASIEDGDLYDATLLVPMAVEEAKDADEAENPLQVARIYERCAALADFLKIKDSYGDKLRQRARTLSEKFPRT